MTQIFNFPPDLYRAVIVGDACPLDPSIVFAVNSINGGAVLSRMTNAEMNAITSPVAGLIVYNLDQERYYYFNGVAWTAFGSGVTPGPTGPVGPTGPTDMVPGPTGPTGATLLSELSDVQLATLTPADILTYNGTKWVNGPDYPALGYTDIITVTSNYSLTLTNVAILCNGLLTITLPSAVGIKGKTYHIKNIGTQIVTINTIGSETVDGSAGIIIKKCWNSYKIISDGVNWFVV